MLSASFMLALENFQKSNRAAEMMAVIQEQYFEEYTDAEEMDSNFCQSFGDIFDLFFPSGETEDGREFEAFTTKPGK